MTGERPAIGSIRVSREGFERGGAAAVCAECALARRVRWADPLTLPAVR